MHQSTKSILTPIMLSCILIPSPLIVELTRNLGKINVARKSGLILVLALTSNDKCVTIYLEEMI